MGGLDRPVLVADAEVVAGWLDPVMIVKALIAMCRVIMGLTVAPCRRQAIRPIGHRRRAELPQRFLQAFGERRETLATLVTLTCCQPEKTIQK